MKIVTTAILLILAFVVLGFGQDESDGPKTYKRWVPEPQLDRFEARTFENVDGFKLPYRLFIPENRVDRKKYPLILYLHGGYARGSDNAKQILRNNLKASHFWIKPENQKRQPSFVLAPQCPEGKRWSGSTADRPFDEIALIMQLISDLETEFNIDPKRLYVVGQSMGGFGTWRIISEYPNSFAAAIPISGSTASRKAKNLIHMPIWIFQGERDRIVNVKKTRAIVEAMKKAGGNPRYTEFAGVEHEAWELAFVVREEMLFSWLFLKKLK